jgi:hypothetical protein
MVVEAAVMVDRKQREKGLETGTTFKGERSCALLPTVRPHLPKFPPLPRIVSPAGDQAFIQRMSLFGGYFISKTSIKPQKDMEEPYVYRYYWMKETNLKKVMYDMIPAI